MRNLSKVFKLPLFLLVLGTPFLPLKGEVRRSSHSVEQCLFKPSAEEAPLFEKLFSDPDLFESADQMRQAGFKVNRRVHEELMVATHPELPKYIFKKYTNKIPQDEQLAKYIHRINGALTIKRTLKKHKFQHLVVPRKGLYPLPPQYGQNTYLVVAEYFDICSGDDQGTGENGQRYYNISPAVLRELVILMHTLGGCDAWPRNQPFTRDGKIVFVDTEHVGQKPRHFARHIIPRLNPQMQQYANNLLRKLN